MYKFIYLMVVISLLTACGVQGPRGFKGDKGDPAPTPAPPVVNEIDQDIEYLVNEENSYRSALGQTLVNSGLSCSVQQIASGTRISSSSSSGLGSLISLTGSQFAYLYEGNFNQPNSNTGVSNLIPTPIAPFFLGKNYFIRCQGFIVVLESDYYEFTVNSDDGSILYLDNAILINNDGNHGMTAITNSKFLRRGLHQFKLEYMQSGGGNHGIILTSGNQLIDPKFFYY